MQNPPANTPSPAIHSEAGVAISPSQLAAMVYGSSTVKIGGFDEQKRIKLPIWMPVASQPNLQPAMAVQKSPIKRAYSIAKLMSVVSVIAIAFWFGGVQQQSFNQISWRVKQVTMNGVLVELNGQLLDIPVGGLLPDGIRVIGNDFVNQTYTTDTQAVKLKKQ